MVPSRGTNTGYSRGPNTWSAGGPIVPSRGTNTDPSWGPNTGLNSAQQGNQHWPLLWAQHLVSRESNGNPAGEPTLAQNRVKRRSNSTQQGTNTGPS
jgi:hypothetical protein